MRKGILFFLIVITSMLTGCLTNNTETLGMGNNLKLIDGIDIKHSFIKDLELKKYRYENDFIENIRIDSLTQNLYRIKFFSYLKSRKFDQDQFEQTFFIEVLLVRIQQTNDSQLYFILNEFFKDNSLSYYLENNELSLFELFLYKPAFFINGAAASKDNGLINYINKELPSAFLYKKSFFEENLAELSVEDNALLISDETISKFNIAELKNEIHHLDTLTAYFAPSLITNWKSEERIYFNINPILKKDLDSLSVDSKNYYKENFSNLFGDYLTKSVYVIQDPDGYTNLRKEKNATSEIIQQIKTGETIDILDDTGDWYLVKTIEGNQGYVHKSRIKFE